MYPLTHLLLTEIYFQKYEKGLNKEEKVTFHMCSIFNDNGS